MKLSRNLFLVLLVLLLSLVFVACGKTTADIVENDDSYQTENDNDDSEANTDESNDDVCFADMLPDHDQFFENGEVTVIDSDGGDMYCISIKNITKEEYDAYKTECENGFFNIVTFKGDTSFKGRDENEEYYVSLQYWQESETDDSQNSINITCGVVNNK